MSVDQDEPLPAQAAAVPELAAAAAVAVALAQEQARQMAAVVAVSAALLLQAAPPVKPAFPFLVSGTLPSPWQLVMRSNQLAKKSRGSLR